MPSRAARVHAGVVTAACALLVGAPFWGGGGGGDSRVQVAELHAQEVRIEARGVPIEEVRAQAKVARLEIVGAEAFSSEEIERRLYTEEPSGLPFFRRTHRLNKKEFLRDLQRVVVFFQQHGYFDADVLGYAARVDEEEDVELEIFVSEGEPSTVDTLAVEIVGAEEPALPAEELDHEDPTVEDLLRRLPLKQGDVFNEAKIDSSQALLSGEFQNRGHAFAEVLKEYRIRKEARSATVIFTVEPGDIYRFGQVGLEGRTDVSEKLIRGQIQFDAGDLFRLSQIYDTQRRLYQLNLFRRVQVQPLYESPVGDSLPVVIRVDDAKEHLVRLGLGYGTEEQLRASASWLNRNFLGGARQARAATEYSKLRRLASVSLTQPNVLIDDVSATATGYFSQDRETFYRVRRLGASGRINHEVSPSVRTFYGYNIERATFTSIDSLEVVEALLGEEFLNPSTLTYLEVGSVLDTSNDIFSPTEGNTVTLNYHLALTALAGDYQYHRFTLLATHYQEVRPGWVLAFKVLPGLLRPFGQISTADSLVSVPLYERLFAGGSTSVRGYGRRRLGPLTGDDDDPDEERNPVGGEALFEGSAELRFPLFGKFRGVTFVDAGNVWRDPNDVTLSELRYTPGVGVRYETPVGPVRVDVGFKTKSDDPGPRFVLHFSIGNAF